jgi:hypothetical protein
VHYFRIMMKRASGRAALVVVALSAAACGGSPPRQSTTTPAMPITGNGHTFGDDLAFLRGHTDVLLLSSPDSKSQVAVAPKYQGRVMTSTADGANGLSFGYLHRPVIEKGTRQPHMTVLGGEDRFWLGPEGGQYALYFPPGSAFDADHWQVPEAIDWDAWPVVSHTDGEAVFRRDVRLTSFAGSAFELRVDRTVRLLDRETIIRLIGRDFTGSVQAVAYQSDNSITNTGQRPWTKEKGLVSIWILGMYPPGPRTAVVIPFVSGDDKTLGPIVNDAYFGPIAPDRLHVGNGVLFFRGDGTKRGKIGIPRPRARDLAGSYDPDSKVLTIVRFTLPGDARDYVNSMWERQQKPYAGDVVNSYNDGALTPGAAPLGPFYEIESSSPAAALQPNGTMRHVHATVHLRGPESQLDAIARSVFGASLEEIESLGASK